MLPELLSEGLGLGAGELLQWIVVCLERPIVYRTSVPDNEVQPTFPAGLGGTSIDLIHDCSI